MGLKFKRFRAKLNWKTKETVPDVVCLRYKIHSEFQDVPPPATSSAQLETSDVIKQKKPVSKPLVQNVFQSSTSTSADIKTNKVNLDKEKNDILVLNQYTTTITNTLAPTKGILKKSTLYDENVLEESSNTSLHQENQNDTSDTDDYKKSALIFMTENHDYNEEPPVRSEDKNYSKETNTELSLAINTLQEKTKLNSRTAVIENNEETVELRFHNSTKTKQKITEYNSDSIEKADKTDKEHKTSTSESESEQADVKTVRWRETVIEIKPPNMQPETNTHSSHVTTNEETEADFQVHFVKHQNFSTLKSEGPETDESEPEEDDHLEVGSHYRNRGAYSSQAASIFFAGEEPEPTPRVRNVSKQDDDISHNIHSTA